MFCPKRSALGSETRRLQKMPLKATWREHCSILYMQRQSGLQCAHFCFWFVFWFARFVCVDRFCVFTLQPHDSTTQNQQRLTKAKTSIATLVPHLATVYLKRPKLNVVGLGNEPLAVLHYWRFHLFQQSEKKAMSSLTLETKNSRKRGKKVFPGQYVPTPPCR